MFKSVINRPSDILKWEDGEYWITNIRVLKNGEVISNLTRHWPVEERLSRDVIFSRMRDCLSVFKYDEVLISGHV